MRAEARRRRFRRKALTGILFVLKTGIPWEDLPRDRLFHRAEDGGILERSGDATSSLGDRAGLDQSLRHQILVRHPGGFGSLDLASPLIFRTLTGLIGT